MRWIIQSEPHKSGTRWEGNVVVVRGGGDYRIPVQHCELVEMSLRLHGRVFGSYLETVRDLMLAGF